MISATRPEKSLPVFWNGKVVGHIPCEDPENWEPFFVDGRPAGYTKSTPVQSGARAFPDLLLKSAKDGLGKLRALALRFNTALV